MKIINIKNGDSTNNTTIIGVVDLSDKQPCWYANIENSTDRYKAKWVVGVKTRDGKDEYSFKASDVGDVGDDDVWSYVLSSNFAIDIIDSFKRGGEAEVKRLVNNAPI